MNQPIFFISNRKEFGWLSNFWGLEPLHPIVVDGVAHWSVETAYVAAKTRDLSIKERIAKMSPVDAKRFGRTLELSYPDWNNVKYDIMKELVWKKFSDSYKLGERLLNTGDRILVEDAPWDRYWGSGKYLSVGPGLNKLGEILMDTRDRLRVCIHD